MIGCDRGIAAVLVVAKTAATTIAIAIECCPKTQIFWTRFHRFAKWVNPSFADASDRSNAYSRNKLFAEWPNRAPAQPPIQRSAQSPIH